MNVVILGGGTVGASIAQLLCDRDANVCVIDAEPAALRMVEESLDVQTILGSACDAIKLFQAGVQSADLCLAVTSNDELNLVGASIAKAMGARRTVARIFNPAFNDHSTFDYQAHFRIDRLLSLEYLAALELAKGIRMPGLHAVENFARGAVTVQELAVDADSRVIDKPLHELSLPKGVRIGLITRNGSGTIPTGDARIQKGDRVTLLGAAGELENVKRIFEHKIPPELNVIIAGGGEIGFHLAVILQPRRCNVVLMEADADRCQYLAGRLDKTTILHADATRRSEMEEARVGNVDVFVACTGRDEDNIICGVEAKELGSKLILSIVRRPDYANVLEKLGIDVAVSPREVMSRQINGMLEAGPIIDRSRIADGDAEVWEVEIREGAKITQAPLRDIKLKHALIASVERDEFVRVPGADDQLRAGESAVVVVQTANAADVLPMFE
ncbi:MAG: Trk system potassium transporter TrkA [Planctomycetota bacterium]|nr:Trk system potassium transporter TrkA [Planctomycetota bacterium]